MSKGIFNSDITVEKLNKELNNNMISHLDIEYTEIGHDYLSGKMPVTYKTKQPMGLLHGGASVVLAESLGSVASNLCIDPEKQYCVGLEVNANHIRSEKDGFVFGKAVAIHIGRKTHIWQITITNSEEKIVCVSRLTVAVIDKK